jgi:hypothetical protein
MLIKEGGEKYTHFEIGGHVQMAKSDPEAQRKSSLSDCTWLENEFGSFNLEALKFLMHFREPGRSCPTRKSFYKPNLSRPLNLARNREAPVRPVHPACRSCKSRLPPSRLRLGRSTYES